MEYKNTKTKSQLEKLKVEVYKSEKKGLNNFINWIWNEPKALKVLLVMSKVVQYTVIISMIILGIYIQSYMLIVISGFFGVVLFYKFFKDYHQRIKIKKEAKKLGIELSDNNMFEDKNLFYIYNNFMKKSKVKKYDRKNKTSK